jgi:hypothetical protein
MLSELGRLSAGPLALSILPAMLACTAAQATKQPVAAQPHASRAQPAPSSTAARNDASAAPTFSVPTAWAEASEFTLPIPTGYRNATTEFPGAEFDVVLARNAARDSSQSTIVVRRVPIPGGSFDDPKECEQTGRGLISGGTDSAGTSGTLKSAQIIDGPVGKTCQIHLVAPQGVAILTELHRPGNSPSTPKDIWLMTCNHVDGDAAAESACRFALSGFRFRNP